MKLLIKLAWRSIWRNKRRTILTILAIVFSSFFIILRNGIAKGTFDANIRALIKSYVGSMQIQMVGYQKNPSLNSSFRYDENINNILKDQKDIESFSQRIETSGLLSYKDNSFGVMIIGLNPATEKKIINLHERLNEGKYIDSDSSDNVVIGYKLLQNLGAKIGDKIVILSQGYDATLGNKIFTISGTIKTGNDFDVTAVIMGIRTCQEFLGMGNRVNSIVILLKNIDKMKLVREQLETIIPPLNLTVIPWDQILTDLKQYMEFDDIKDNIFLGILIVIVAFGILNTIYMSVTERFREFGITLSIGMKQSNLVKQVFIEALFITIIGLILGNLVGLSINYYIYKNPIPLSGDFAAIYQEYGFIPQIAASMQPSIYINTSIAILIIFLISMIYPLIKVYKIEPLKGMRYT
jgi:ABC-type lipoprotein release transport system permease subunit